MRQLQVRQWIQCLTVAAQSGKKLNAVYNTVGFTRLLWDTTGETIARLPP